MVVAVVAHEGVVRASQSAANSYSLVYCCSSYWHGLGRTSGKFPSENMMFALVLFYHVVVMSYFPRAGVS
eukprot:6203110-Pleurochrysis_carterae.AAC.4